MIIVRHAPVALGHVDDGIAAGEAVRADLTRGQDALLTDASPRDEGQARGMHAAAIDLSAFELPVLRANAQEAAAHEEVMAQIDKASGGKTVWRLASAPAKG